MQKNYIKLHVFGFIKSIKRFDVSLNLRISTYAVPYVMGEIKRFIRDNRSNKNK